MVYKFTLGGGNHLNVEETKNTFILKDKAS